MPSDRISIRHMVAAQPGWTTRITYTWDGHEDTYTAVIVAWLALEDSEGFNWLEPVWLDSPESELIYPSSPFFPDNITNREIVPPAL